MKVKSSLTSFEKEKNEITDYSSKMIWTKIWFGKESQVALKTEHQFEIFQHESFTYRREVIDAFFRSY